MFKQFSKFASILCLSIAGEANVEICHTVNAGYLITDGKSSVLIDSLYSTGFEGDGVPSPEFLAQMTSGQAPFDNVKLVIASHKHTDHFNAADTLTHMRANPNTKYIVPSETLPMLDDAGITNDEKARVTGTYPPLNTPTSFQYGDINVSVHQVSHGAGRTEENLGTLVTIASKTFLHLGDMEATAEDLATAGFNKKSLDVLLPPFWMLINPTRREILEKAFAPTTVIPTHMPISDAPWVKRMGGVQKIREFVATSRPDILMLNEKLACHTVS